MRTRINSIVACLLIAFITGCATMPVMITEPIKNEDVFNRPIDEVWKICVTILVKSGVAINTTDRPAGLISYNLNFSKGIRNVVIEPAPFMCDYTGGTAYVSLLINAVDAEYTKVYIKTNFSGTLFNAWDGRTINANNLTSNGELEKDFFNKLSAELAVKKYEWLEEDTNEDKDTSTESAPPEKVQEPVEPIISVIAAPETSPKLPQQSWSIMSVQSEYRFVMIDVGEERLVLGTIYNVYDGESLVGKVKARKLDAPFLVADIISEVSPGAIRRGNITKKVSQLK